MQKKEALDLLLQENQGYMQTSAAMQLGVSRTYFGAYVKERGLRRVAHGLYMSDDAWQDGMYVLQVRYPKAVFSHETALFLLDLAEREPLQYAISLASGTNTAKLSKEGVRVYKIQEKLFDLGITETKSPSGHILRVYNLERTICDLLRSRRNVDIQDLQGALKTYVRMKKKNLPLLMRYAKAFSVENLVRQYLEVLL